MSQLIPTTCRAALAIALAAAISGCAGPNPRDPYEGFNRAMFKFNDTVDQVALKPAATAYRDVLPSFVQTGVNNFFGNLSDAWSAVNNLLQGKGQAGMSDVERFTLNTSFGLLGFLDFATPAGLPKHNEDFGQTLGYWGVPSGPYLMLPLLGPSTVRDTAALPADFAGDIWRYKDPVYIRNIGTATRIVDQRANLLDASNLLEEAALDRYEFVRDGYLQRRENMIFDGEDNPRRPKHKSDDDDDMKPEAKPDSAKPAPAGTADTAAPSSAAPAAKEVNSGSPAANNASL